MIEPAYTYAAKVVRIIDADTYEVEIDVGFRMWTRLPLRLAFVDAPERFTEDGRLAEEFVSRWLGRLPATIVVRTHKSGDKYGRYLAEVWRGEENLADEMIEAGHAVLYRSGAPRG